MKGRLQLRRKVKIKRKVTNRDKGKVKKVRVTNNNKLNVTNG